MPAETVKAGPTKRFFVSMLTRDIELEDAILDLLDNCIDGIQRSADDPDDPYKPYTGYWAEIIATPEEFEIKDNCGGIPVDIAKESAFMIGRPEDRDEGLKTVGMYGIGMKRAIFKLGREAVVRSQPDTGPYEVEIPEEWFSDEQDWELSLETTDEGLEEDGTRIRVVKILPEISRQFDPEKSTFLKDLRRDISRFYSIIIQKGFTVTLNGEEVDAAPVSILAPEEFSVEGLIKPYVFKGTIDEVEVSMAVGFYRRLASVEEVEEESEEPQEGSHRAGWTVICNDRVILFGDKTPVTGWATANVPAYHPQFRAIAGVVVFESAASFKLPLKTTKRGLEMSNPVYLAALDYMREGIKLFTGFTNRWKAQEREAGDAFARTSARSIGELVDLVPEDAWSQVARLSGNGNAATRYTPELPKPKGKDRLTRIQFHRPPEDVKAVSLKLFDEPDKSPQAVGERCFDLQLGSEEPK